MTSYKSTQLSTKFPVKDKTDFQHKNNVVYHSKCPSEGCRENYYIGETNKRIVDRIQDHNNRDKNSHLLIHAREKRLTHVWESDFKILGNNYQSNIKREINEFLYIRQNLPEIQMKNQFHYSLLIDFFIAITLREVLSNHLLKVIINNIVV